MKRITICIALILAMFCTVSALMPQYSNLHLVNTSDRIVVAKITGMSGCLDIQEHGICTPWNIAVEEDIIGCGDKTVTFFTEGGYLPDEHRALWVEDQPQPIVGQCAIIFLEEIDGRLWVNGLMLGFRPFTASEMIRGVSVETYIEYLRALAGGIEYPMPEPIEVSSPMAISSISPTEGVGGDGTVTLIISGSGFGSIEGDVEFTYYQWPGDDPTFLDPSWTTIHSWTNTEIHTDIAPNASSGPVRVTPSGSPSMVSAQSFHVWFGYNGDRWSGPTPIAVSLKHNDSTFPVAGCLTAILNAMTTWSNGGAPFSYTNGGTTTDGDAQYDGDANGRNAIHFGYFGGGSPPLGQCRVYLAGPPWFINEMDIRLNIEETWSASTPVTANDVETCCLHEMGHGLQLLDLYGILDEGKVMFGVSMYGSPLRTLHSRDRQGIQYIYGSLGAKDKAPIFDAEILLSPNPAISKAMMTIIAPQEMSADVEIIDITGKVVAKPFSGTVRYGKNTVELDMHNHKPGLYFVKATMGNQIVMKRVVNLR